MKKLIAASLFLALSAQAESEPVSAHGRFFSDVYTAINKAKGAKSFNELSLSSWLQVERRWSETLSFTSVGEAILEGESNSSAHKKISFDGSLREGYLTYAKSGLELRVGKQIIPWGKSDGFNPIDVLTAKDTARFNVDQEVQRLGAPGFSFSFTPSEGVSPFTITAVFNAIPPESSLLIPSSSLPSSAVLLESRSMAKNFKNSEQALKLSYFSSDWDLSLVAFNGKDHLPELSNGGLSSGKLNLLPIYRNIKLLGGDSSLSFESFVLRFESAYTWTENQKGDNALFQPSHWDSVLGVERPFGDYFRVQAQALYKYLPNFTPPQNSVVGSSAVEIFLNRSVATANAALHNYQDRSKVGGTFRAALAHESLPFEAELFVLAYPRTEEYLLRPKFLYKWADSFKTELGLEQYIGASSRPLGAFKEFNSIFFEAKYLF